MLFRKTTTMPEVHKGKPKLALFSTGLITLLLGVYPLLKNAPWMPPVLSIIPAEGTIYYTLIIIIGALAVYFSIRQ